MSPVELRARGRERARAIVQREEEIRRVRRVVVAMVSLGADIEGGEQAIARALAESSPVLNIGETVGILRQLRAAAQGRRFVRPRT